MKIAPAPIRWFLKVAGYKAITLPPFGIYAMPESANSELLRRHEMVHWEQAQRYGTLGFYARYLWFTLRHGYWNNPMEVEARRVSGF